MQSAVLFVCLLFFCFEEDFNSLHSFLAVCCFFVLRRTLILCIPFSPLTIADCNHSVARGWRAKKGHVELSDQLWVRLCHKMNMLNFERFNC